jgi:mRNA-degrading endonuclease RelE of RelBE toxin-antitoxin system
MFDVILSNKAKKDLKSLYKIEKKVAERVNVALSDIGYNPLPFKKHDMDKVESEKDTFRLRISSYRVVYKIFWKDKLIRVIKIEKKGDETYKIR